MRRSVFSISGILLLLGILVLANSLSQALFGRFFFDLTKERLYSLSDGSRNIIASIQTPITLKFYFSKNESANYPALAVYGSRVRDLLREYQRVSKGKVKLEIADPMPDSEEEEWAQKYGLTPIPTRTGEQLFFGAVGVSAEGKEEAIPLFNLGREELLEYDLTKLIYNLNQSKKPVIGIISSLKVEGSTPPGMPPGMPPGVTTGSEPWFFIDQLNQVADVKHLELDTAEIPSDVSVLLLIHPRGISELTTYAIDQFVMRGGRLFAFVDPWCQMDEPTSNPEDPMQAMHADRSSDLNRLFSSWGVELQPKKVIGDPKIATKVNTGRGNAYQNFILWLSLTGANMDSEDSVTAQLENVVLLWPGALEIKKVDGITVTPLLKTSESAHLFQEKDYQSGVGDPESILKSYNPDHREYILAARITGKLKSAFPNGKPAAKKEDSATEEGEESKGVDEVAETPINGAAHLPQSKDISNVVVVADADFLADRFSVAAQNVFGAKMYSLLNDNSVFVQNVTENLAGSNDLISIRSRGQFSRPFTKVQEIEQSAEERWRNEEELLQMRLQQANQRLTELQSSGPGSGAEVGGGNAVFDEAILSEIRKFREERKEAQSRLREVRRNLRADKERLGDVLFMLNTFLVPAILIVVSVYAAYHSKRKSEVA